jgi:hypothetical protein
LSNQSNVRLAHPTSLRFAGVFGSVKNENLSCDSFGGNQVRILRHVAGPVDLPFMVDFLDDLNARCRRNGVATQLAPFIIVVRSVQFLRASGISAFGYLYRGDLEIILGLPRGVCPEKETMRGVRLACRPVNGAR